MELFKKVGRWGFHHTYTDANITQTHPLILTHGRSSLIYIDTLLQIGSLHLSDFKATASMLGPINFSIALSDKSCIRYLSQVTAVYVRLELEIIVNNIFCRTRGKASGIAAN